MSRTIDVLHKWARHVFFGYDGTNAQAAYVDSDGAVRVKGQIDAGVDVEIDGVAMTLSVGDKSTSGDTVAVSVTGGNKAKIYAVGISPDANLTGDVTAKLGAVQVSPKMRNAIVGGVHWLIPPSSNYILGADGADVNINNTVAEALSYVVYYDVVPA
ncbi:hypothetical protein KAR91_08105 [Candidatus Pacearchaeota archaeon]|nr:hypothetical protein [Candidatus Pacearchaeota archaeon]